MSLFSELGVQDDRVSPEMLLNIGKAAGRMNGNVIVGTDAGGARQMMFSALASGIMSAGANVCNAGIVTMPTLVLASKGVGCGLMAGVDDAGRNRLRLWNKDGTAFNDIQISSLVSSVNNAVELPEYRFVGKMRESTDAIAAHKNAVIKMLGRADCPVVLDCSSDAASLIVPSLLTEMGCDVTAVNSHISQNVMHEKDAEGRMREFAEAVKRNKGEIGIAVNIDGTRASLVDETGVYVDSSIVLALFAKYLNPHRIVVPVDASMMIDDIVDGTVIRETKGARTVGKAMQENEAEFGGLTSGMFIFPSLTYCPDGVLSAALLSKMAGENRIRDMIDSLPEYASQELSFRYEGRPADIAKKIDERVSTLEYEKLITTDGWRVEMDSGWYLIRFSRKEPVIRVNAEARDKVYMNCLVDIAKDVVNYALK